MLKDFVINGTIVISGLFIMGQIFRNHPVKPYSPSKLKLLTALLFGLLGAVLMEFSIRIVPGVIADLRHIPVALAALYGGIPTALVSALIIAMARVILFPAGSEAFVAFGGMLLIGLGCGLLTRSKSRPLVKFMLMNLFSLLIITASLFINIPTAPLFLETALYHWCISITAGFFAFYTYIYIDQSNEAFRRLKEYSTKDFLTGLNNSRQFTIFFNAYLQRAKERGESFSLLVIDIDHFKEVNDTYGHPNGDKILQELGQVLSNAARPVDIVSRNGGEEFSILMLDCSRLEARYNAEHIRAMVERHVFTTLDGERIHITVSVGGASFPETHAEEMYHLADKLLYEAKRTGRNKVCWVDILQEDQL
ncbi:diguanylate cyclase [Aneurinibacillus migulanus]|uniref:diguanylate cyclase n=1 Tax=Aneurinibacillus migulanus TaxID=47500 RepID=UPI002E1BF1CD|nr:diguanylate cyclase [Aneurinibacillus migulanus]MED4729875.1 diguanylate cyclase [Aneurinibacillus migulanus]